MCMGQMILLFPECYLMGIFHVRIFLMCDAKIDLSAACLLVYFVIPYCTSSGFVLDLTDY